MKTSGFVKLMRNMGKKVSISNMQITTKIKQSGITLIELLICIAVIFILSSVTLILTQHLLQTNYSKTTQQQLISLLNFARSEAINLNQTVNICPSADQENCVQDWQQPLMIFTEDKISKTKKILHISRHITHGIIAVQFSYPNGMIVFEPDGTVNNGNINYCEKNASWQLVLNVAGRIRIKEWDTCNN